MGIMVSELVGHWMAHRPQPMQSSGEMASTYCMSAPTLPFTGICLVWAGAAAISASVSAKGRTTACGHTNEHWLHSMQVSGFHSGTDTATPRFS